MAQAAVSALGWTVLALCPERPGDVARVAIAHDEAFAAAGLARPRAARVARLDDHAPTAAGPDRAARLLGSALISLVASLDLQHPHWRASRLGLALGSSSGGMGSIEELFHARAAVAMDHEHEHGHENVPVQGGTWSGTGIAPELARRATYFGPVAPALASVGLALADFTERTHVLAACAASTFALGVAMRWLERDAVDLVIAGGYDALTLLVASGFEAIRATTATTPSPFRLGRDGMALGEGAGLVALVRTDAAASAGASSFVRGFGAATDAVHITAPDRTGDGLARAAERAIVDAGVLARDVALVSAHATATPFNDLMEASAIRRVLGSTRVPVQPLKAQIGHTLGAAGVLETLAAASCLERGLAPPAAGHGAVDPAAEVRLLAVAEPLVVAPGADPLVLKCSAAFGGANAALIIGRSPGGVVRRASRRVWFGPRARIAGAEEARAALDAAGISLERQSKLDSLSLLACGAVAALAATGAPLRGGGVVVGHALGTLDIDERFFARVRTRGGAHAEPRLFPATSPNVCAGHAAILFGLRGPSAAVSGGLDGGVEALALATELVAAGDADGVVVVAVDEIGPAGAAVLAAGFPNRALPPDGAVAVWVSAACVSAASVGAEDGAALVPLGIQPDHEGLLIGHASLAARLDALECAGSAGSRAR